MFGAGERFRTQLDCRLINQSLQVIARQARLPAPAPEPAQSTPRSAGERLEAYKATSIGARHSARARDHRAAQGLARHRLPLRLDQGPEGARAEFTLLSLPGVGRLGLRRTTGSTRPAAERCAPRLTPFVDLLGTDRNFLRGPGDPHPLPAAPRGAAARAGLARLGRRHGRRRTATRCRPTSGSTPAAAARSAASATSWPGRSTRTTSPLGGRSVLEGSVELRTRFAENDSGRGCSSTAARSTIQLFPSSTETVLFGAGPSFRYFTPIGPSGSISASR